MDMSPQENDDGVHIVLGNRWCSDKLKIDVGVVKVKNELTITKGYNASQTKRHIYVLNVNFDTKKSDFSFLINGKLRRKFKSSVFRVIETDGKTHVDLDYSYIDRDDYSLLISMYRIFRDLIKV